MEHSPPPPQFVDNQLVSVLTTQPLDRFLDYKAPAGGVCQGAFVEVPLGPRWVLGVVWGAGQGGYDPKKIRRVFSVLDVPPMRPKMQEFLTRVGDYTLTPMHTMLRLASRTPGLTSTPGQRRVYHLGTAMPDRMTPARSKVIALLEEDPDRRYFATELATLSGVSSSVVKGLLAQNVIVESEVPRDLPYPDLDANLPGKKLSLAQTSAAEALGLAVRCKSYSTTLLKGVTGSGKTEVYLEAVAACLKQGRQALVLLPEIALTVEFLDRVEQRFGTHPAEWHSGVTQTERRRCWHMVAKNKAPLVVGARSALYLPFADLGLIVVDEEHDTSYKQEDGAAYNARDMAVLRASICNASVVLASATPSLESWVNAKQGKYHRLDLPQRYGAARLPDIHLVDLRSHELPAGRWISAPLAQAISRSIAANEQAMLFLNRRGYAPVTVCRACGHQLGCDHCDARLVEHRFQARMMCHQCGFSRPSLPICPACGVADKLAPVGPGVERLAEEAAELYPDARIAILSSDMSLSARALKARIRQIAAGEADLIIGTQLVAKGHNFPLLSCVGVIDADLGLQGGDLRAAERTFQLMRQVAGRAGRADIPGVALLQTTQPEHPVIQAIQNGDEESFWQAEAAQRQAAGVPPFGRLAGVVVSGPDQKTVFDVAQFLARNTQQLRTLGAQVFGPAPAPIARIRGRFRVRLLVKAAKSAPLQPALASWRNAVKLPPNIRVSIDIDPQSFF